ncbi:MAG: hypothetical protein KDD41_01770 [Flavobacteriales bacterium]|nr:hypothetical protein [Flavobacteriales bacterium]
MKNTSGIYFVVTFLSILVLHSCSNGPVHIELTDSNLNENHQYLLDYTNAYEYGFVVPSMKQDGAESFQVSFKVDHFDADTLYYKLFYQNETYKFPDSLELAGENFYGTSESTLEHFSKGVRQDDGSFLIEDEIIIRGNPRNEDIYFGKNEHNVNRNQDTSGLANMILKIKNDQNWYADIVRKAESNGLDVDIQLMLDAKWILFNSNGEGANNNRWKRNLRVGNYSLLLVVTDKNGLEKTPDHVVNTTAKTDKGFTNPYHFFASDSNELYTSFSIDSFINIKAEIPLANGIYVPFKRHYTKAYFNDYVNDHDELFINAAIEIQETSLHSKEVENVPVKAKFITGDYTKQEYADNSTKYENNRVKIRFTNTHEPGKTFGIDTTNNTLWFKNPYYEDEFRKENVGIRTRHGLTYGKYTFKIKMANLLTKDNVWTGLTNALWLVKESDDQWNSRRICQGEGFMPFYGAGEGEKRVPQISYSEIDFEILKTAEVWPWTSYEDKQERDDPPSNDDKVMVTCTNWDMACMQPKNFGIGIQKTQYDGKEFHPHRWNEFYNALTAKWPEKDTELFGGEYYFFQIEWSPTEIIWRLGPSKDDLRVVCYMNEDITTIPNNQMVALITQEYHFAEWWPKSPYKQGNVPFPGEDLNGRLYSLEIE